jgi:Tannase and feruloyl esterase
MPWTRISGRLFGHGGKLLQYHGWNDTLIAPKNSLNYYTSVADALGGANKVNDSYRLFTVPGMAHCRGRDGTDRCDVISAMEQWVEKRKTPESIIAPRYANDRPDRTRPLCPHPQVAPYKGIGSTDDAANFICTGTTDPGSVAVVDGPVQRLPVPSSSEYPAFRRDHWAVGRPSVRVTWLPFHRFGQAVGESSHVSCRP